MVAAATGAPVGVATSARTIDRLVGAVATHDPNRTQIRCVGCPMHLIFLNEKSILQARDPNSLSPIGKSSGNSSFSFDERFLSFREKDY
jgi:hypothetical protein